MFVSPRPLGMMATPGTYLSIEAYAEECDVAVIAKPQTEGKDVLVHAISEMVPVTLIAPEKSDYVEKAIGAIRSFNPDIVCIGSSPGWHTLASKLRSQCPDLFIALEVKSPVVENSESRLARDRMRWQNEQEALDAIIAPSRGMVSTYIGKIDRPLLQHRSMLDYSAIAKKQHDSERVFCRRFVFAGSLTKLRQLDKLIRLIAGLPDELLGNMKLDIIGSGPVQSDLMKIAETMGLGRTIHFLGALPQRELFQRFQQYDAGIAWVPTDIYDSAPSLKLIEYCASGIVPLATSTSGHRLLESHGFAVNYFNEDDEQSFAQSIRLLLAEGFETRRLRKNVRLAEQFDYRSVVSKEILPFYRSVMNARHGDYHQPDSSAEPSNGFGGYPAQLDGSITPIHPEIMRTTGIIKERALHASRMTANR